MRNTINRNDVDTQIVALLKGKKLSLKDLRRGITEPTFLALESALQVQFAQDVAGKLTRQGKILRAKTDYEVDGVTKQVYTYCLPAPVKSTPKRVRPSRSKAAIAARAAAQKSAALDQLGVAAS